MCDPTIYASGTLRPSDATASFDRPSDEALGAVTTTSNAGGNVPITLPSCFDTRNVWRTILKGAFAIDVVLLMPGPSGTYALGRSAVRVEFRSGAVTLRQVRILWLASVLILAVTACRQAVVTLPAVATAGRAPGTLFRDCPDCPEMVVIPPGHLTMGSSASEKTWAASHGGNLASVADESPQHIVSLPSFALGKYDVTRGEYAAFVRETGYPAGDGCGRGRAIFKWEKDPKLTWENPGQAQTDRDPVVCVSWQDARAYIAWLNRKVRQKISASGDGP